MIDSLLRQLQQTLAPADTMRPGRLLTNHHDGSCTVQLDEGGLIRVSGDMPENTLVYIRNTTIVSEAPDLPFLNLEI